MDELDLIFQSAISHGNLDGLRCGRFTSSRYGDLMTGAVKPGTRINDLLCELDDCSRERAQEIHKEESERKPPSKKVLAKSELVKSGLPIDYGDTFNSYVLEVVTERLTGVSKPEFETAATRWGNEHEDEARIWFVEKTGIEVKPSPFIAKHSYAGGSPDGYVENGLIEIKCPYSSSNHVKNISRGTPPEIYIPQIQGNLWASNRDFCYFISYDPRFPDDQKGMYCKVERDEEFINKIATRVQKAEEQANRIIHELSNNGNAD